MRPSLLLPPAMPALAGLEVPRDFYWVLAAPAPLAGMVFPRGPARWAEMQAAGFRHVVCLTNETFPYAPVPLNALAAVALMDLYGGLQPPAPAAEQEQIWRVAGLVRARLEQGEGVVVHCAGGTGRTGTVIGCVLRGLGYPVGEVVDYLNRLHQSRGRAGWPESPWQAEVVAGL